MLVYQIFLIISIEIFSIEGAVSDGAIILQSP